VGGGTSSHDGREKTPSPSQEKKKALALRGKSQKGRLAHHDVEKEGKREIGSSVENTFAIESNKTSRGRRDFEEASFAKREEGSSIGRGESSSLKEEKHSSLRP